MNRDSREENVMSKALKFVGTATVVNGAAYGGYLYGESERGKAFISKHFGKKDTASGNVKDRAKNTANNTANNRANNRANDTANNRAKNTANNTANSTTNSTASGNVKDIFSKKPTQNTVTNPNDIVLKNKKVIRNPEKSHSSKIDPIKKPLSGDAGNILLNTTGDTAGGRNINTPMDTDIAINPKGDTPVSQKFERKESLAKSKEIVTDKVGNTNGGKNINAPEVKPNILGSNGTPVSGGGSKAANILGADGSPIRGGTKNPVNILGSDGNPLKGGSKASKIITGQADDVAKKIILGGADDAAAGAAKIITKLL